MSGAANSLLLTLVGAMAVGAPALFYTIWRGRKIGPKEEDELIARMAQESVSAGREMLIEAREERREIRAKLAKAEARVKELEDDLAGCRCRS